MEYIDLGLPSKTLWASHNVGANTDTEFGTYFKHHNIPQEYECPTNKQIEELINNTTLEWIVKDNVNGCLFTGDNGNSIFLPAAAYYHGDYIHDKNQGGYYWSAQTDKDDQEYAYYMYFDSSVCHLYNGAINYDKLTLRPVKTL